MDALKTNERLFKKQIIEKEKIMEKLKKEKKKAEDEWSSCKNKLYQLQENYKGNII